MYRQDTGKKREFLSLLFMLIILLLLLAVGQPASAGPADPEPITLSNPNGKSFKGRIRGDEFQNWIEAENGYSIIRNESTKYWEYAEQGPDETLRSSGALFEPGKAAPARLEKGLKPKRNSGAEAEFSRMLQEMYQERISPPQTSGGFEAAVGDWVPAPVSGTKNVLVILVNFADRSLITTADSWNSTLFDNAPGAKSLVRFYADNSYGAVTILPVAHTQAGNPAGIVTVTVADNHPNSGGNSNYTIESTILNHALAQSAPYIDFASFDTSGDGILQQSELNIYFIYAGYEASGTTKTPNIWAHAWGGSGVTAGGKQVRKWALNGELNSADLQHPMGVIAHEMGHSICGFPDLYDTSYYNAGLGAFSLMAGGSWGGDTGEYGGTTPVALDAWSRQYVGWAAPVSPPAGLTVSFPLPLSTPDSSYKFGAATPDAAEYFLAENRFPVGWDLGLKRYLGSGWQGGLLVLHVDITSGTLGSNNINRYDVNPHQGVMVEEASSADCSLSYTSCRGKGTNLFYAGHRDAFTDLNLPNTRYYNDISSLFGLISISAPGQVMTAVVAAAPAITRNHPADNATGVGMGAGVSVSFNKAVDASTVNGSTFRLSRGSTPVAGSLSFDAATQTVTFTPSAPLAADTSYTATVTTGVLGLDGNPLGEKTWSFTTGTEMMRESFDTWFRPAGWTVRDNAGSGAKWSFDDQHRRNNWNGGSGGFAIIDSDLFGQVAVDAELRTPTMDLSGYNNAELSFKTDFYHYSDEVVDVDISTDGGSTWTNIWRQSGIDYRLKSETVDISQFARNHNVVIRFRYYNAYYEWFWSVDDVTVAVSSPVPQIRTLNANVSGSGNGTVMVNPGAIAFNTNHVVQFDEGTMLTLSPSAGEFSAFTGWSGACGGTADCSLTMDSDKTVTAVFDKDTAHMTRIGDTSTYFSTLQAAYEGAPAGSTIKVWGTEFTENVNCAMTKAVTIEGGYNAGYSDAVGYTTLKGTLTIASGALTLENLVIR